MAERTGTATEELCLAIAAAIALADKQENMIVAALLHHVLIIAQCDEEPAQL
jgi:hypothetical protein